MDILTIGLGVAAVGYGCYAGYIRKKDPTKFGKLEAMKRFWGEKAGLAIHFVAYTVMPIAFGIALIIAGGARSWTSGLTHLARVAGTHLPLAVTFLIP